MKPLHQPVLLDAVISTLAPKSGEVYLDGTAGYGGHAAAVLERTGDAAHAILVDRDAFATRALAERFGDRARIIHASFASCAKNLADEGVLVDMILLDLGVSSPQLDNAERGFSFKATAALDMRMDQTQALTAADVVNRYAPAALERILREYGEEPKARRVAQAIVDHRPYATTTDLAKVIRRAAAPTKDIDQATRSFQAIRLEVNAELSELSEALPNLVRLLAPGGRLAVISFHSLEDRIVKQFFNTESRDCICPPKAPVCTCGHTASLQKLTKSAVIADSSEIASNPRARSAKLRAAEKKHQNQRRQ